ncbi:MAG: hypothetical protein RL755_36 [Pseudomonadota bacterium]|jgi:uncharacterized membrane-anchored protein YhcB (DUF1043 family)
MKTPKQQAIQQALDACFVEIETQRDELKEYARLTALSDDAEIVETLEKLRQLLLAIYPTKG